ncbi:MAG: SGNH/GDSL hydrolase family protein [Candidatus Omnitrophica bacterium]|nr:SGNH/GDSL hydrolase family protein [Candidatus Omnitrophota bacterium]
MDMKNVRQKALLCCIFLLCLFFASAEIALRKAGHEPWRSKETDIVIEPGGKFITKDPVLGYKNPPGRFKLSMPYPPYSVSVTILENNRRITRPLSAYDKPYNKKEIWIFGGSFTYGWLVNDKETYPWLVQEGFPDYEVVNFGVNGYGTLHSLLQLQGALKTGGRPELAILAYASFHDQRNTFCRSRLKAFRRRSFLDGFSHPYARIDREGRVSYQSSGRSYNAPPFIGHSSFINWLDNQYNRIERYFYHNREVSKLLIKEFSGLCSDNAIRFVVAGIWSDPLTYDMLEYCKEQGIATVDISVELDNETTFRPHDGHPNALAHKKIAYKLITFLEGFLDRSIVYNPDS